MHTKHILITGVSSYIGNSFNLWLQKNNISYKIDTISMRNEEWQKKDFTVYDSILHVSALVHQKEFKEFEEIYFKVNTANTYHLAKMAKKANVKQFVFLSTMAIYGDEEVNITRYTIPRPKTYYGRSKLLAEQKISMLSDERFKIAIIRPPMVYGKGCPGNYSKLSNLVSTSPFFPKIKNKRSMIFIDNLCMLLQQIIEHVEEGIFCPQDVNYVCTSEMVKEIARVKQRKIIITPIFNPCLFAIKNRVPVIKKMFGNLTYDVSLSNEIKLNYQVVDWKTSIHQTEI